MIQYIPPYNELTRCREHILATDADYFANLREPNLNNNLIDKYTLSIGDFIWLPVAYVNMRNNQVTPEYRKYYVTQNSTANNNQTIELMRVSTKKSPRELLADYDVHTMNPSCPSEVIQPDRCYQLSIDDLPDKLYCESNDPLLTNDIMNVQLELLDQLTQQSYIEDDYRHDNGIIVKCNNIMQFHKIKCANYPSERIPNIVEHIRQHPDTIHPLLPSKIKDDELIQREYPHANAQDIACLLAIGKYRRSRHLDDIKTALRVHDYDRIQQIVEPQSQPIIIESSEPEPDVELNQEENQPESPIEPEPSNNEAQPVEHATETASTDEQFVSTIEQSETNSSTTSGSTDSHLAQPVHHHTVHHRHHHDDDLEL